MRAASILVVLLIMALYSQGDVLIVDKNSATAFATIQEAINQAKSGDTVQIAPGEYNEQIRIVKGITLDGSGYENTFLRYTTSAVSLSTNEPVVIRNVRITSDEGNGIDVRGDTPPHGLRIENCRITGCGRHGIEYYGTDTLLIVNSMIDHCGETGIVLSAFENHSSRLVLLNSIVANNRDGIVTTYSNTTGFPTYLHLQNVLVLANSGIGLDNNVNASGDILNSIFTSNERGAESNGPLHVRYSNFSLNVYDTTYGLILVEGITTANPLIQEDYQFLPDSPAIDAGSPSPFYQDLDGTRNDLGAYGGPLGGPAGTKKVAADLGEWVWY